MTFNPRMREIIPKRPYCKVEDADFIPLTDIKITSLKEAIKHETVSFSKENLSFDELLRLQTFLLKGRFSFNFKLGCWLLTLLDLVWLQQ